MKKLTILILILSNFFLYGQWNIGADSNRNLTIGYNSDNLFLNSKITGSYKLSKNDYVDWGDVEETVFYIKPGIELGRFYKYNIISVFPFIGIEKDIPIYIKIIDEDNSDTSEDEKHLRDYYDSYYFSFGTGFMSLISERLNIGFQLRIKILLSKELGISGSRYIDKYIYTDNTLFLSINL